MKCKLNSLKPTASLETIQKTHRWPPCWGGGQATNNTEIIHVLTFIKQTMETSTHNKQLKTKLDINLAHQEAL